jgi:transposase
LVPECCAGCSASLAGARITHVEARQQTEVVVTVLVTEYRAQTLLCGSCHKTTSAKFPASVKARVSYGPVARAACLEMSVLGMVPLRVVASLCASILGVHLSHAVLPQWVWSAAKHLRTSGFEEALVKALRGAPILHADETPISLSGEVGYVHVQMSDTLTYLFAGDRSRNAIKSGGILDRYEGTLVSDDYVAYKNLLGEGGLRQLCWAHLIRDLNKLWMALHPTTKGNLDTSRPHPHPRLWDLLTEARSLIHQVNVRGGGAALPAPHPARFRTILEQAKVELGEPVGPTEVELRTLLNRLTTRDGDLWHFLAGVVPATNNAAERAVRPEKVRAARSGGYRNAQAMKDRLLLRSYLECLRQNNLDRSKHLKALACGGDVWLPGAPA